ncbi:MAG: TetR/AcrR family transcriptional regulator [Actinomycetota bacterium]|nr:TetR/AcrR family transcriptional regulator [Actinomycetota bacterium]
MMALDLAGTTIAPEVRRKRGRPRSVDAHRRILDATLAICAAEGYRDLTIESVARTAGVGKSTIYRHWRSKRELIQEAIARESESLGRNMDSGDLEKDLRTFISNLVGLLSSPTGSAIAHLVGEAQSNPSVGALVAATWDVHRRGALVKLLESHMPQSEVRAGVDAERVSEAVFGSLFMRRIIMGATLGEADVEAVADLVLHGMLAPVPVRA